MTDSLIQKLESAEGGSRKLSDGCLLAIGWRDAGKHLGQWIRPDGSRCYKSDAPHVTANVQDAMDWMVPEGYWREICDEVDGRASTNLIPKEGFGFNFVGRAADMSLSICSASLCAREVLKEKWPISSNFSI